MSDQEMHVSLTIQGLGPDGHTQGPSRRVEAVVDTGAPRTLVSARLAKEIGIVPATGAPMPKLRSITGQPLATWQGWARLLVDACSPVDMLVAVDGDPTNPWGDEAILGFDFLSSSSLWVHPASRLAFCVPRR